MVRGGRERDDQIKSPKIVAHLLEFMETSGLMPLQVHADFGTDGNREPIGVQIGLDPHRLHIDLAAVELLHHPLGHRRARRVMVAAEQDGVGKLAHQLTGVSTQTRVNRRRAVSMSISALPERRSCNTRAPSLWMPRRAMSTASIWLGGSFFTASK